MVSEHASPLEVRGGVADAQNLHVHELSQALARQGHQVAVYTRQASPEARERVTTDCGYDVVPVPAGPAQPLGEEQLLPYMRDFAEFLYGEWRADPPDIAHAHVWLPGLAACLAGKHTGTPVVQTYHVLGVVKRRHHGSVDASSPGRPRIERLVGRAAARVIATSSDEVFELARMGVSRRKITAIPCGVDGEVFTPTGPAVRKHAAHRLVAVGPLAPHSGFDVVIGALLQLPGTDLVIAGQPEGEKLAADPEARRLTGLADEAGVTDRVHLIGPLARDDMPALLRSADLVVCTPTYEPHAIVALEAMACGVPVVASAVGALTDAVVDRVTGLHVPPGDAGALVAAVRGLLAEPMRRQAMGVAGRDRVSSRYGWDRIAAETLRTYEQAARSAVAARNPGPPASAQHASAFRVPVGQRRAGT
jgi:glycosyltransferase involved in cell wall biosynthesis